MKWFKKLIFLYLFFVIVKIFLVYMIPAPSEFNDGYIYAKMARSFFNSFEFSVHGIPARLYPPLYPAILSIYYIFKDMHIVYFTMKIINSILSSLIIFPAWLIAREFVSRRKAFIAATLVSIIPSNFSFAPFIMAENLFYPLFLFTVYFAYKYLKKNSHLYAALSGFFLGLTYLTKTTTIVLVISIFLLSLYKIANKDICINKFLIFCSAALAIIIPWTIIKGLIFGFTPIGIFGVYVTEAAKFTLSNFWSNFAIWIILYSGFIILASGIIFFVSSALLLKNKQTKTIFLIFLLSTITIILMGANHNVEESTINSQYITGRPVGRYIDTTLSLLFILGFIGLDMYIRNKEKLHKYFKKVAMATIPIVAFSSLLVMFPLFPVNNMSLTWLGLSNFILDILINNKVDFNPAFSLINIIIIAAILISIILVFSYNLLKVNLQKVIAFFILFFILVNASNYAIAYYNSNTYWYKGEQMQLGIWFNDFDKDRISNILIDKTDCGTQIDKLSQYSLCHYPIFTIIGFWLNDEIKIQVPDNLEGFDYIISRHNLPLEIIRETESGIKIYKTK